MDRDPREFTAAGYREQYGPSEEEKRAEARAAWGLPEVAAAAGSLVAIGVGAVGAIVGVEGYLAGEMTQAVTGGLITVTTVVAEAALLMLMSYAGQKGGRR